MLHSMCEKLAVCLSPAIPTQNSESRAHLYRSSPYTEDHNLPIRLTTLPKTIMGIGQVAIKCGPKNGTLYRAKFTMVDSNVRPPVRYKNLHLID
jgi:hypothetical protein